MYVCMYVWARAWLHRLVMSLPDTFSKTSLKAPLEMSKVRMFLPTAVMMVEAASLNTEAVGGMKSLVFFSGTKCMSLELQATMLL